MGLFDIFKKSSGTEDRTIITVGQNPHNAAEKLIGDMQKKEQVLTPERKAVLLAGMTP